jgi:ATP-dependent DNA helicase RecQ
MINNDIHLLVEQAINEKSNEIFDIDLSKVGEVEQYKYSTAIRLLKSWDKQKVDKKYKLDFECSLRNYLLLMKKEIVILGYEVSEKFEKFGLNIDINSGRIWVTLLLPNFVNKHHVKKLYMDEVPEKKVDNTHNLTTNSFIQNLTGFTMFKSFEQKLAVMGALRTPNGYTCLVSMSTGGGKSLITQTLAYQREGLSIVIVPTISLMLDQAKNANNIINSKTQEEVFYYYSGYDLTKFYKCLKEKKARLLFVSPESLIKNSKLRASIEKVNNEGYLKNLIIDEAHIIIEWGSAFRIDFQCLDAMRNKLLCENQDLRTFLLSATYSDETIRQLKLFYSNEDKWIEIRCDRLRHETRFDIIRCTSYSEKNKNIEEAIRLLPHPMIVYVKSPDDAEKLKNQLSEYGYNNIYTFTGNTNKSQREKLINSWKNNEFDLMIATCAFGVGVDKKDVRTVLHTYIPENPNKYYQEAGRGGRDGLPCLSTVIYIDQDIDSAFSLVSKVITTDKLSGRWFSMLNSSKTQSLSNGKYVIDTYVKPDYNTNEDFIDSISNQDVNWNVYVVLFLRRNGVLSIDDIIYLDDKYLFYITIKDRQILINDDKTKKIMDELRDDEWKKLEYEFMLMKKNLQKVGKSCWSSMFNKIYRKTYEYCAGCNEHNETIDFEDSKLLKKNIDFPLACIGNEIKEFSYGSKCMLIINKTDVLYSFVNIIENGIDVIVADNSFINQIINKNKAFNSSLLYCNYMDFFELTTSNKYFMSGSIAIYIPEYESIRKKIISIIEKNTKKYEIEYILISNKDYYLSFKNKNLSEVINGPCKQEY